MDIAKLALRGVVGGLFVGHGTQKLFGWFGGHGPEATGAAFESMGLRPGRRNAIAAGAAEAGGGALLVLGAATPLAATTVASTMITAIRKVHAPKGPWVTEGGWEYNAVLITAMAVLAESGPGSPSVDSKLFPDWHGRRWALATLAAATAGSYLIDALSEPAPEDTASAGDPDVTAAAAEQARFAKEQATAPHGS
ncbi:DoxX family protein [Baekduia sp. Peel2402]|uniref:DoxX family protein n=1 Tax=Baekduia sp. Peel2402 TaxID=3458296 RepID=UPI00403EC954